MLPLLSARRSDRSDGGYVSDCSAGLVCLARMPPPQARSLGSGNAEPRQVPRRKAPSSEPHPKPDTLRVNLDGSVKSKLPFQSMNSSGTRRVETKWGIGAAFSLRRKWTDHLLSAGLAAGSLHR